MFSFFWSSQLARSPFALENCVYSSVSSVSLLRMASIYLITQCCAVDVRFGAPLKSHMFMLALVDAPYNPVLSSHVDAKVNSGLWALVRFVYASVANCQFNIGD